MKKQHVKYLVYILVLVLSAVVAIGIINGNNFDQTIAIIGKADPILIILMMMIMVFFYILEGLILTIFARLYDKKYRWKQGTYNGLIGVFINGVTPSASGGQFVQAYTFTKQGIPITQSASILLMHFITYQMSMVIFCFITLASNFKAAYAAVKWNGLNVVHLSLLGFAINVAVILGLYFVAYSRHIHRFVSVTVFNFLAKIKIIRKKEQAKEKFMLQVKSFKIEATKLNKNWKVMLTITSLQIFKFVILYMIPFFAMRAVGIEIRSQDIFLVICFTSFVYLITSFFPLPGASGGAELIFTTFFLYFLPDGVISADLSAMMLIWRFITFYFGLIMGGLTFFLYRESGKSEIKKVPDPIKFYETAKIEKVIIEEAKAKVVFKEKQQQDDDLE